MKLVCVGNHTIDMDRLTGGAVLDAGCRNFTPRTFSREVALTGCRVIALDADPTVTDPGIDGVTYLNLAISHIAGQFEFVMHSNPEARALLTRGMPQTQFPTVSVEAVTIDHLMLRYSITHWDAVKLDVEGAEYEILRNWPGPIANQISIEFHEHVQPRDPELYRAIFDHLGRWYDVVQHVKEARHCTHPNYWDTLLVLRENT